MVFVYGMIQSYKIQKFKFILINKIFELISYIFIYFISNELQHRRRWNEKMVLKIRYQENRWEQRTLVSLSICCWYIIYNTDYPYGDYCSSAYFFVGMRLDF